MPTPPPAPFDPVAIAAAVRGMPLQVVQARLGKGDMTTAGRLQLIAVASTVFEAARECLDETVRSARASGASWAEIGQVLGITRQAAFQRFGR